jgi:hypothetical protein
VARCFNRLSRAAPTVEVPQQVRRGGVDECLRAADDCRVARLQQPNVDILQQVIDVVARDPATAKEPAQAVVVRVVHQRGQVCVRSGSVRDR